MEKKLILKLMAPDTAKIKDALIANEKKAPLVNRFILTPPTQRSNLIKVQEN